MWIETSPGEWRFAVRLVEERGAGMVKAYFLPHGWHPLTGIHAQKALQLVRAQAIPSPSHLDYHNSLEHRFQASGMLPHHSED